MRIVETDVLVVGAGPAGLTAATFLGRYGVKAVTVSKYDGPADSPRAHVTNMRTVEILRDLGVEDQVMAAAMPQDKIGTLVFATAFAGQELCRAMASGKASDRCGEFEAASPSHICNVHQHLLEPIILGAAEKHGADIRFGVELVKLSQDGEAVHAVVRERATGEEYAIRAKYAIGCDGARSTVAEQIGFEIEGGMGVGEAFTVWVEADLTPYTEYRSGILFFVCQPGSDIWISSWTPVKPWTEWNALFLRHALDRADLSEEAALKRVRDAIGDPSVEVKIKKITPWQINHAVAARYRMGRVFLAGDAAHRHPPSNGLGTNTSIQDCYNLTWKLALVLSGKAGDRLLDSYSAERQPVGRRVVDRANKSVAEMLPWSQAMGLGPGQTEEEAWASLAELYGDSEVGARRREAMLAGLDLMNYQLNALGVDLDQRYESDAVVGDGTPFPPYERDPDLHYHPTTHPGAYLPHVWLGRGRERISTLDLARGGRFSLITGIGGEAWIEAARRVGGEFGVDIAGYRVGIRQDYDDVLGEWTRRREIGDHGCILIRPDGYIAWRSRDAVADPVEALRKVMAAILARDPATALDAATGGPTAVPASA